MMEDGFYLSDLPDHFMAIFWPIVNLKTSIIVTVDTLIMVLIYATIKLDTYKK